MSLANWFVVQRDPSRATGGVYRADIFVGAIEGDTTSEKKAQQRLAGIADLLTTLGSKASVEIRTHIEAFDPKSIKRPERLDVLTATVQPACAKTGSCCKWSSGPGPRPDRE